MKWNRRRKVAADGAHWIPFVEKVTWPFILLALFFITHSSATSLGTWIGPVGLFFFLREGRSVLEEDLIIRFLFDGNKRFKQSFTAVMLKTV
ncbi:protein Wnt [Caerostris extrusa]|uniref:Protein Wnt n=1 Tax=Caerostris extrusa TaxID=172846 RepID=A0AAV4QRG0_CAEEX|nr:protein Wnt [Caerostris extrusa]